MEKKIDYNSSEVTDIIEDEEFTTHNIKIKDKDTIIVDGRINIYLKGKCYSGCVDGEILKC
jgi:hypothetical protein